MRFYDASNSAGARYESGSGSSASGLLSDLTDRDTATGTGTAMDSSPASVDFLYFCTTDVIGGLHVVIGSANGTASTTTIVEYRKNDDTWAALTISDGTASGGVGLAQTGAITWTAPTDAKPVSLGGPQGIVTDTDAPGNFGFWWRVSWDEALDSDTEIDEIWTLNKATDRGYYRAAVEYPISLDRRNVGAIEAVLASSTDTLQVTWLRMAGV